MIQTILDARVSFVIWSATPHPVLIDGANLVLDQDTAAAWLADLPGSPDIMDKEALTVLSGLFGGACVTRHRESDETYRPPT